MSFKKYKRPVKRRTASYGLLLFTLIFWMIAGLATAWFVHANSSELGNNIGTEVGKQYLATAFPAISRSAGSQMREENPTADGNQGKTVESLILNQQTVPESVEPAESGLVVDSASGGAPKILIYHTHATESYQPVSEGNFHSIDEKGTVREVGEVLKSALEARGISVIHDKTLHDSPSYNKSYSRSIETVEAILRANPSIEIVIDLHRDAASYTGNIGHTFMVDGKTAAQFKLVVGKGNENATELLAFANRMNQKANALYPGFSRGIIEKDYKFNQSINDHCLLLEMGNNQNTIEEAKTAAIYFADALVELLEEL